MENTAISIPEGNRIIHEWMGKEYFKAMDDGRYRDAQTGDLLDYHKNWALLMDVVAEIKKCIQRAKYAGNVWYNNSIFNYQYMIEKLYELHFAVNLPEGTWIDINAIDGCRQANGLSGHQIEK